MPSAPKKVNQKTDMAMPLRPKLMERKSSVSWSHL